MRRIGISPKAEQDLLQIFRYYEMINPQIADRFQISTEKSLEDLADMPRMGKRFLHGR